MPAKNNVNKIFLTNISIINPPLKHAQNIKKKNVFIEPIGVGLELIMMAVQYHKGKSKLDHTRRTSYFAIMKSQCSSPAPPQWEHTMVQESQNLHLVEGSPSLVPRSNTNSKTIRDLIIVIITITKSNLRLNSSIIKNIK